MTTVCFIDNSTRKEKEHRIDYVIGEYYVNRDDYISDIDGYSDGHT